MTNVVEQVIIEELEREDLVEDIVDDYAFNNAIDTNICFDEDTGDYDPDAGMLFPQV